MTNLSQLLPSFVIAQSVIAGLTRPFGRPFQVTPKGSCSEGVVIQWTYLVPFALVAMATILGILINTSAHSELNVEPGFGVNVFWRFFFWRWRCASSRPIGLHGRLPASEPAVIRDQGQPDSACIIVEISLGGAKNCGSPAGVGESRRSRRFIAARRRFATTFPVSSAGPKAKSWP